MSDKTKSFVAPAPKTAIKSKIRPSTVGIATSSRARVPAIVSKEKVSAGRINNKRNTTISEADITISKPDIPSGTTFDMDAEYRQIAEGKYLREMLEYCMVDEKINREETELDTQIAHLADRFQKTMDQLDKTNRRLKDISFVVENQRLLDLKSKDCSQFYEATENSNAASILQELNSTQQSYLDNLETKNVDFGINKDCGHKKLLDAVNEALEGFEQIKSQSKLDDSKFKEYENSLNYLDDMKKEKFNLEMLKSEFEGDFPKISEKLFKEASEKICKMIAHDDDGDDEEDED